MNKPVRRGERMVSDQAPSRYYQPNCITCQLIGVREIAEMKVQYDASQGMKLAHPKMPKIKIILLHYTLKN